MPFSPPPKEIYYSYHILKGEQGVLTFEPYKSHLLPLWRFRTVPIAQQSSAALWDEFLTFHQRGDFVGMDMARKFIQMGMTRAKRYANHKGGRKFEKGEDGKRGRLIEKSEGHDGKEEKEEASAVFREVWERCKAHKGYAELKERFLEGQREWEGVGGDQSMSEKRDTVKRNPIQSKKRNSVRGIQIKSEKRDTEEIVQDINRRRSKRLKNQK